MSTIGGDFGGDPILDNEILHLSLFGAGGNFLQSASVQSPYAQPNLQPISIARALPDIRYAVFTYQNDLGFYEIDNITYENRQAVPEPMSLMLLGSGLSALALRRRRKSGSLRS